MKRIASFIILAYTAVLFLQCRKEGNSIDPGFYNSGAAPVTASIQGNITDENGLAAAGVNIKIGTRTAITDGRGYFRIMNASLDKNASLVIAEKPGYFKAYRSFSATSGVNQVTIKLLKKTFAGTVDAGSDGEITLSNGAKVVLPGNGVVKAAAGTAHTGAINVYATYIDPTSSDIAQKIPGSLMGNDKNGKRVTLSSYGMLAVELESSSGEKLQIATGNTAALTTPIPASLRSSAPATISLWYIDEQTGIWKEEGTATKIGNNYVGTVKHFSYWNCDINVPAIAFSAVLRTPDGSPLIYEQVSIRTVSTVVGDTISSFGSAHGNTDSLGQVGGLIPANLELVMDVSGLCGNIIYSKNIGPFSSNTDLGEIIISDAQNNIVTIKGKLVNCNNVPVTKGYVQVDYEGYPRYVSCNSNGQFAANFISCGSAPANCSLIAIDENAQQQSGRVTLTISSSVIDAGNISVCGNSSLEYINYSLDGINYSIGDNNSSTDSVYLYDYNNFFSVSGWDYNNNNNIYFNILYNANNDTYSIEDSLSVQTHRSLDPVLSVNVIMTKKAQYVGDYYEGSFSGQFEDPLNDLIPIHTVSCSFRLRKDY